MFSQKVNSFIEKVANLRVAVIGETIVDEFIDVVYEGQSMKSFCPVFRLEGENTKQVGGAGAIANHLKGFVKSVELITNTNEEIVKTRYIDVNSREKHVEVNKFNNSKFSEISISSADYDAVIIADFGHGFCNYLNIDGAFHLMCQTNSNNFGFNRISKWKANEKQSVCIDLREASLQMNKRYSNLDDAEAIELFQYEMGTKDLFVTLGNSGAVYTNGNEVERHKSFTTTVIDTIGAGDTFFAFASLTSAIGLPAKEKLIIPSLAANLSTTWLCNEKSVTKESLLEHADRVI